MKNPFFIVIIVLINCLSIIDDLYSQSVLPHIGNTSITCNGSTYYNNSTNPINLFTNQAVVVIINGSNGGTIVATQGGIALQIREVTTQNNNQVNLTSIDSYNAIQNIKNTWWAGEVLGNETSIAQYLHIESTWNNWSAGGVYKTFSATFNFLKPGTYHLYTKMYLTDGLGNWPRDPSGSTPNGDHLGEATYLIGTLNVQVPSPIATSATGITQNSFIANWGSVTGATAYYLDVSNLPDFSTKLSGYNNKLMYTSLSGSVVGLASGNTYYYQVRANIGSISSSNSNRISTITIPGTPTANPATNITSNSFTANWNNMTGASGYYLDVSADNFQTFVNGYQNLLCSSNSQVVSGLNPLKYYYYRVRSRNTSGTSSNSNPITVQTLQAPPSTGTLVVSIKNINGTGTPLPGSNGIVRLFNSGNIQIGSDQQTDVNGNVTFSNVPAGTGYYFRVYHNPSNPSTIFGQEYWGQMSGITITGGQTTTNTFTRNQPYSYLVKVFINSTNVEVTGQTVPPNTELRIEQTIVNPASVSQSAKGRVVLDINKASLYDFDLTTTTFKSVAANNGTITEIWLRTPTITGTYYFAAAAETSLSGTPLYSDGGAWSANPLFTIPDPTGSLMIAVKNIDGTGSPLPGIEGRVRLFNSSGIQIGSELNTNESGEVIFSNLPTGSNYYYEVYHDPINPPTPFGREFWGKRTGLTITTAGVTENFIRNQPYGSEFHIFNGTAEITEQTVIAPGTPLRVEYTIINPASSAQNGKGWILIDQSKLDPIDFTLKGSYQILNPGSTKQIMNFTPTLSGTYYVTGGVDVSNNSTPVFTDGGKWATSPTFYVSGTQIPTTIYHPDDIGTGLTPLNFNGKPGTLVLLEAVLYRNVLGIPLLELDNKLIRWEIQLTNGIWDYIPEDGISTTNQIQSSNIISHVPCKNYFLIPDNLNDTKNSIKYPIRAVFDGDNEYSGCSRTGILTVDPIINEVTPIHTHEVGDGIPLILVHGNGADKSEKHPLSRWDTFRDFVNLRPDLFREFDIFIWHHITEIPIGFNGTTGNAKQLSKYIEDNFPGKKIILLAHSQGGLICRSYMNYNNQGNNVLGLITLGTPHHGSPFAVPDWTAMVWGITYGTSPFSKDCYHLFVNTNDDGLLTRFDYDRVGDLNLAWDNSDNVVNSFLGGPFPGIRFSVNGDLQLSNHDMNQTSEYQDITLLYSDIIKKEFGTLNNLNQNEKYQSRIIAYAAYDDNLNDNPTGLNVLESVQKTGLEHGGLSCLTYLLSRMDYKIAENNSVYYANDGLVPLQSALFLNSSTGVQFSSNNGGIISHNVALIDANKKIKQHRIFYGSKDGIKDHLHLLDAPITSNYWDTLAFDIRSFIPSTGSKLNGLLSYNNQVSTPLNNVSAQLLNTSNSIVGNTNTDALGNFSFSGLINGNYSLRFNITKPWSGITAMDITSYKKHIGALALLKPLQVKSGDVNGSNSLTAMDLTIIKQRIGAQISSFPVGDWVYDTPLISVNGSDIIQNISALCYGDANGSYTPSKSSESGSEVFLTSNESVISISDKEFEVPIRVNKNIFRLSSVTLAFSYPSDVLDLKNVQFSANNDDLDYFSKDGSVIVIYSSLKPVDLKINDLIMTIRFSFKDGLKQASLNNFKLTLSGDGEFGDYDDKIIEGVQLYYASENIITASQLIKNNVVLIYPNPTNNQITLTNVENSTIIIYDINGIIRFSEKCYSGEMTLNVRNYQTGTYIIKINKGNCLIHKKLLIIR